MVKRFNHGCRNVRGSRRSRSSGTCGGGRSGRCSRSRNVRVGVVEDEQEEGYE